MSAKTAFKRACSAYRKYLRQVNSISMRAECVPGISNYLSEQVAASNAIAKLERVPRPAGFDTPQRMMLTNPPLPTEFYKVQTERKGITRAKATIAYIQTRDTFRGVGLADAEAKLEECRRYHRAAAMELGKRSPLPDARMTIEQEATRDAAAAPQNLRAFTTILNSLQRKAA